MIQRRNELAVTVARQQGELGSVGPQLGALIQERAEYQHLMLGRLGTLQSEFGTLQRSLARLSTVPSELVVADSFIGLPSPNPEQYPADRGDTHHTERALAVSLEEVRDNFSRYDLLDEQVRFLKGWFKDTLPNAPIERLALLRLDGDMYGSTIQTLDALYWKLSSRGFIIIDDYILPACKQAIDDFRAQHRITAKLEVVDGAAVYWRKPPDDPWRRCGLLRMPPDNAATMRPAMPNRKR